MPKTKQAGKQAQGITVIWKYRPLHEASAAKLKLRNNSAAVQSCDHRENLPDPLHYISAHISPGNLIISSPLSPTFSYLLPPPSSSSPPGAGPPRHILFLPPPHPVISSFLYPFPYILSPHPTISSFPRSSPHLLPPPPHPNISSTCPSLILTRSVFSFAINRNGTRVINVLIVPTMSKWADPFSTSPIA